MSCLPPVCEPCQDTRGKVFFAVTILIRLRFSIWLELSIEGQAWPRTLLEAIEKAGKSTALAVAHFLDALIQLTRRGNT